MPSGKRQNSAPSAPPTRAAANPGADSGAFPQGLESLPSPSTSAPNPMISAPVSAGKPPHPSLEEMGESAGTGADLDNDDLLSEIVRRVSSGTMEMGHLVAVLQVLHQMQNPDAMMNPGGPMGQPPGQPPGMQPPGAPGQPGL